eukprot:GEMP01037541.1.p3 GENE.GEMP01037541.1~~GEMP01037541.1.p3  ORF type:complete len:141 (+),score=37.69 GEMP01037541.1:25-447(+)
MILRWVVACAVLRSIYTAASGAREVSEVAHEAPENLYAASEDVRKVSEDAHEVFEDTHEEPENACAASEDINEVPQDPAGDQPSVAIPILTDAEAEGSGARDADEADNELQHMHRCDDVHGLQPSWFTQLSVWQNMIAIT